MNSTYKVGTFTNGIASVKLGKLPNLMEIRIVVKKFVNWPAMRFEILYTDNNYLAFLENAIKYKDQLREESISMPGVPGTWKSISDPGLWQVGKLVSSGTEKGYENFTLKSSSGWKSSTNNTKVYAGLKFNASKNIVGLKISNGTNVDVIDFSVEASQTLTNQTFTKVPLQSNYSESSGIRTYSFVTPIKASEVRIIVNKYAKWPGFKFDLFGATSMSDGSLPKIPPKNVSTTTQNTAKPATNNNTTKNSPTATNSKPATSSNSSMNGTNTANSRL